jgi:anti-sigma B factor antagonist
MNAGVVVTDVLSYISGEDPWERVMPFDVQVVTQDDRRTFLLSGDLDVSSADQVEAIIRQAFSPGTAAVVLDLREVTYMDSSGLRVIVAAAQLCEQHGSEFALVPGPPEVQRVFELTGISEHLPFTTGGSALQKSPKPARLVRDFARRPGWPGRSSP